MKITVLELASFSISLSVDLKCSTDNSYPIMELRVRLLTQHAIMEYKGQSAHRTKILVSVPSRPQNLVDTWCSLVIQQDDLCCIP